MPTIVLATGNPHKVEELRAIFAGVAAGSTLRVIGIKDISGHERFHEPEEIGHTCEENARIKAVSYAEQIASGTPLAVLCLADDSGIEIDSLRMPDGTPRPGVISSHYSTDGRETGASRAERDAANNGRVLRELNGVPESGRGARFVCHMCLTDAAGHVLHETRGTMEGRIGEPPRVPSGGSGFGYDPLFLVAPEFSRTGAELSSEEKNRLSHRGMAARAMAGWIATRAGG